jgi:hypothetical protein
MHESCSFEVDIDSKMHHANVSKESFSSPLRDLGSEPYTDVILRYNDV